MSVEKAIWDQELKEFVKRKSAFKGTLAAIQEVFLGQCSEDMKDRLKALPGYKERTKKLECAWVLNQILSITLRFDSRKNAFVSLMSAQRALFYTCKQHPGQSPTAYLEELRGWAVTITQQGANIAGNPNLIPETDENGRTHALRCRSPSASLRQSFGHCFDHRRGSNSIWCHDHETIESLRTRV